MGELFRQIQPETSLPWTGERMVTSLDGAIEAEHYHRYFLARELCRGKDVLDVASGEGYGSAFLAQTARSVVGVEIDPASVEHACRVYQASNLRYTVGDAARLPLDNRSVDAVVSFETIEHLSDQAAFLAEVKRVLRPGGFLIVSTPDMDVYSALGTEANPYHVREMTAAEFREALAQAFRNVALVRQRAISGSVILADRGAGGDQCTWIFEQRDSRAFEVDHRLLRAPFLLAVASDRDVPSLGLSLYIQTVNVTNVAAELKAELQRLRDLEENVRRQAPDVAKAMSDAAAVPALQAELDRLRSVEDLAREQGLTLAKVQAEAAVIQAELDRLRKVEDMAREQLATTARLSSDAASARAEAEGYRLANESLHASRENLQLQFNATQDELAALRTEHLTLQDERDHTQDELSALQAQLNSLQSMARQQSLTAQRSMLELLGVRQDLDRYKAGYEEANNLLIPLRVRRAAPEWLKPSLRAIKRAARALTRRTP